MSAGDYDVDLHVDGGTADQIDQLQTDLRAAGLRTPDAYGVTIRESADELGRNITLIVITLIITRLSTPTLDALLDTPAKQIADRIQRVIGVIDKQFDKWSATYVLTVVVDGKEEARYWVPTNGEERRALATLLEDFEERVGQHPERRWWPGEGWVTKDEMDERLRLKRDRETKGRRAAPGGRTA